MRSVLAFLSLAIGLGCYIPYGVDIARNKAIPARSARIMFTILLIVALVLQHDLGSGWALAVTIGEATGSIGILYLALQKGVGGLSRLDVVCYTLLLVAVLVWVTTQNAFVALHVAILADVVAFVPTVVKTWRWPESETPFFFAAGVIAPLLSIAAQPQITYAVALFPAYLSLVNGVELGLILFKTHGSESRSARIVSTKLKT